MTRSTILFLLSALLSFPVTAQTVFIPDEDLQVYLYGKCAACMDTVSGMMDADLWNSAPVGMNIPHNLAQDGHLDLTGLDALIVPFMSFDQVGGNVPTITFPAYPLQLGGMDVAQVDFAQFPDVATLTNAFTSFGCFACGITDIPLFASLLSNLNISGVNLSMGANVVPATVTLLSLQSCQLTNSPVLPAGLQMCFLGNNALSSLPPTLPAGLHMLHLGNNTVSTLPELPASLTSLNVGNNPITTLPQLPAGLASLTISQTLIVDQLPPLPPGLGTLAMAGMQADVIPGALPSTLEVLFVYNSPVASIPSLPVVLDRLLAFGATELSCLPVLPDGLTDLQLSGSGVQCLPNIPTGLLSPENVGIPLVVCDPATACPVFDPLVMGTVFSDLDNDGVQGVDDPPLPNAIVRTIPGNTLTASGVDGRYVLPVSTGPYNVDGVPIPYNTITTAPHAVELTGPGQVDSLNHVGYHATPGIFDLVVSAITSTVMVPGSEGDVWFTVKNIGTEPTSAEVTFTLDPALTWQSALPAVTSLSGNTGTWAIPQVGVGELLSFRVVAYTDPSIVLGTPLVCQVTAQPGQADMSPLDNFRLLNGITVSSYDPNDKLVEPSWLTPVEVEDGTRVTYTIRFQNTGTAPAQRVVIRDTLRSGLQRPTFQFLGSSHPCHWNMLRSTLYFIFDDIMLPDSATDEAGSHGYVQFSVIPRTDLALGEQVTNEAFIYFDFNEPVLTEQAVLTVETSTRVPDERAVGVDLWPNPVDDVLFIAGTIAGQRIEVCDVTGRALQRVAATDGRSVVDLSALASGTYVVRLVEQGLMLTRSFIKR